MAAGVPWTWESFPALSRRARDAVAPTSISPPSCRTIRCASSSWASAARAREPPTAGDLADHAPPHRRGDRGRGAGGHHHPQSGAPLPERRDAFPPSPPRRPRCWRWPRASRDAGAGVFQLLGETSASAGAADGPPAPGGRGLRPSGLLHPHPGPFPAGRLARDAAADGEAPTPTGACIRGQVLPRPIGMLIGLELSLHPFALKPSFRRHRRPAAGGQGRGHARSGPARAPPRRGGAAIPTRCCCSSPARPTGSSCSAIRPTTTRRPSRQHRRPRPRRGPRSDGADLRRSSWRATGARSCISRPPTVRASGSRRRAPSSSATTTRCWALATAGPTTASSATPPIRPTC